MRALEILLLAILALTLIKNPWSTAKSAERLGLYLPALALLVFLLHAVLEKTRWQMTPAYALTACLVILALARFILPGEWVTSKWRWVNNLGRFIGLFLAWLSLTAALILSVVAPVFRMPAPSGMYPVGMQSLYFVDNNRPELFTPEANDHRELMVRVWYPADPPSGASLQPYWSEVDRVGPLILKRMDLPTFLFSHMDLVKSYSYLNAPLSGELSTFPALVFSHGYGMDEYTRHQTQMEELASHGYIVFSINHTYESMSTVFPDGRIILADPRVFDASFNQEYRRLNFDDQLGVWVADAIFVLDQLEELNAGNVSNSFIGRLDMKRVGVFGMSFGGAMSAEVCLKDSRCKAGANMDGSQFGYVDFSAQHLKTPFLFFYNERSEGMNDYIYTGVENWAYRVTIQGTTHASFTDTILWSPSMEYSSKFIPQQFGPIDSQRMIEIQRAYLLAFFDRHLKGENTPFLDGPPGVFPEVDFQFRKQSD